MTTIIRQVAAVSLDDVAAQLHDAFTAARDAVDAGEPIVIVAETAIEVAEASIQVHGGMGFTWEMGLHFYLRTMLVRRQLVHGLWA